VDIAVRDACLKGWLGAFVDGLFSRLSILAQARAAILPHLMSGTRHNGSRWVRMPRYFFNVYHERSEPDDLGEVLPDRQAAWKEATITAGQILQSLDGKLRPGCDWRMEVTDESSNALYVICISAKYAPSGRE
jgi:hypothetical protein